MVFIRRNLFSLKATILFFVCCIVLCAGGVSSVSAESAKPAGQDEASCVPVVVLKNREYYPALTKAIGEAQKEILMSFFLFKTGVNKKNYPDRIASHLIRAAKRGVIVKVILEQTGGRDGKLDEENAATGRLLQNAGINVYFDAPRKTTHTKLVVIDRNIVFSGSHNLTQAALKYNNEISVMFVSRDSAEEARAYLLAIIKEAR